MVALIRPSHKTRALHIQLSGTILVTLAIGLGLLIVIAGAQMSDMSYTAFAHEQQNLALIVASTLGQPAERPANGMLQIDQQQALAQVTQHNAFLSIFNRDGSRLAATLNAPLPPANAPELSGALRGQMVNQTRNGHLYIAVPIVHNSSLVIGAVWLDASLETVEASLRERWLILFGAAFSTLAIAALTAWYLAGQIVRPLSALSAAAQQMADGQLDTRVAETSSVTELAALGSVFNHMAAQIENTVARQREFVANASHELRAPLSAIRLRAEMLAGGALDAEEAGRYAGEIDLEATQLGQLVSELLQLARAEDETFRPPAELIAPAEVIADCLRAARPGTTRKHQQLQVSIAPNLPDVRIAPGDLRSMVGNLLDNATKYTPEGGCITVNAYRDAQCKQWFIEVRDTGIGIPPEDLTRVTERFFRVDRAHTRQIPGTGLGLALVLALARRYGGRLDIQSSGILGEGTFARLQLSAA